MKTKLATLLLAHALLAGLTACVTEPHYRGSDRDGTYYDRDGHADHDYYYYPAVSVYFHVRTGYYYFPDRGRWVRARELPPYLYLDSRHRQHLVIRDGEPYRWHDDHVRKFATPRDWRGDPDNDRSERDANRRAHDRYERGDQDGKGGRTVRMPDRAGPPPQAVTPPARPDYRVPPSPPNQPAGPDDNRQSTWPNRGGRDVPMAPRQPDQNVPDTSRGYRHGDRHDRDDKADGPPSGQPPQGTPDRKGGGRGDAPDREGSKAAPASPDTRDSRQGYRPVDRHDQDGRKDVPPSGQVQPQGTPDRKGGGRSDAPDREGPKAAPTPPDQRDSRSPPGRPGEPRSGPSGRDDDPRGQARSVPPHDQKGGRPDDDKERR